MQGKDDTNSHHKSRQNLVSRKECTHTGTRVSTRRQGSYQVRVLAQLTQNYRSSMTSRQLGVVEALAIEWCVAHEAKKKGGLGFWILRFSSTRTFVLKVGANVLLDPTPCWIGE